MEKVANETPLMTQWRAAKARHPDAIVFFRVGDFYEMFCEDAEEGARLLGLTLTSRNNGGAADVPLAGVPVRAKDEYLQRLVRHPPRASCRGGSGNRSGRACHATAAITAAGRMVPAFVCTWRSPPARVTTAASPVRTCPPRASM